MLYALTWDARFWHFTCFVSADRAAALNEARRVGILLAEHYEVDASEFHDDAGRDLWEVLASDDAEDVLEALHEIDCQVREWDGAFVCLDEFDDLFELVDELDLEEACGESLWRRVAELRKSYRALVREIGERLC